MNYFFNARASDLRTEVLSGITVALALVPSSIAFSMIAGFSPLVGLYSSFVMGIVAAIFGGRPAMITASAGAIAVIFVGLIDELKQTYPEITGDEIIQYVFLTVIVGGVLQIVFGLLRLGKYMRLVPAPVLFGFLNGLAIIIFTSQLTHFYETDSDELLASQPLMMLIGFTIITMLLIWGFPKITKVVPSSLVAVIVVSLVVIGFSIDTKTVGDTLKEGQSIQGTLPPLTIPNIPDFWAGLIIVLPYAGILAVVGLLESLLTLNIIDQKTNSRGNSNRECLGLGAANVASGFFSGMGGCGVLGQSLLNINNGARNRISAIIAALLILIFILFGAKLVELLPMAALIGLMFMVAIDTFEWASLKIYKKMPTSDVIVMVLVTLITVFTHNLAVAVLIGILIAALAFAWENAIKIRVKGRIDLEGVKQYQVIGPLFFASVGNFEEKFDVEKDPAQVVISFKKSRVADMSAIETLNNLTASYQKAGKIVKLKYLSPDCREMLRNADEFIEINIEDDPSYKVMLDKI